MKKIIQKAFDTQNLSKEEIVKILEANTFNDYLFKKADEKRKQCVGDEIYLRGLIEFSNICSNSCFYCGLRCENNNIKRYKMPIENILLQAKVVVESGMKTIVLQSGESNAYKTDVICELIKEIKKYDVAVTLSIGEKTFEEYKRYKESEADRYLLRIETTDEDLYKKMHSNMSLKNRIDCLYNLKKLGYEVGTGCLVGLPEQSIESLANDILFFKELNADMIGVGPFIPHQDTPLKKAPKGDFFLALKVMALSRLLLPYANIPATTAMETIYPNGRIVALQSGANVVMPNFTDEVDRELYSIYPNKTSINVSTQNSLNSLKIEFEKIGRTISTDYGNCKNR